MSGLVPRLRGLLEGCVADPQAEAEALARAAGGDPARAEELARARAAGRPLAYLTGRQLFMGVELEAAEGALVPRAETELLGETAVALLREAEVREGRPARFVDLCCGSGNLVCGIAARLPGARAWACDLTGGAVALARRNVARLGLEGRVSVLQGDLLAPLAGLGLEGALDAVVCNPPYISSGRLAKDRAALLAHEPREAFDGGPYGLSIHQRAVREAAPLLRPGGALVFEVGEGQDKQVTSLFARAVSYDAAETRADAAGKGRVVLARKKG